MDPVRNISKAKSTQTDNAAQQSRVSNGMNKLPRAAVKAYIIGFILSIVLTLLAFALVSEHVNSEHTAFSHSGLTLTLAGLATAQLLVQLVFFLHLGKESKPKLNLMAFYFMLLTVVIIVFGSLWIMDNLAYNHGNNATNQEVSDYIIKDEGIKYSQ